MWKGNAGTGYEVWIDEISLRSESWYESWYRFVVPWGTVQLLTSLKLDLKLLNKFNNKIFNTLVLRFIALIPLLTTHFCNADKINEWMSWNTLKKKKRLTMVLLCDSSWMCCCLMGNEASALISEQSVTAVHLNCASRPFALQYIDLCGYLVICLENLSGWHVGHSLSNLLIDSLGWSPCLQVLI